MPIYTTYLGFLNKHGGANKVAMKIGSCFVYYVMLNRGNNAVAPDEALLFAVKKEGLSWAGYCKEYAEKLQSSDALKWMEKRTGEAKISNILLVCFEKDAAHCHRRLLAQEIARRFGAKYEGELSIYPSLFSNG